MEGGKLPSARTLLRATRVDNILYVTGGSNNGMDELDSILSWNPSTETWQEVVNSHLAVARYGHAALAMPSSIIEYECLAMSTLGL